MKAFRAFLEISACSISLASIIFMGFVFWNEVRGHGVLYVEPNLYMALSELLICAFGLGTTLGSFIRKMRE